MLLFLLLVLLAGVVAAVFVRRARPAAFVIIAMVIYVPSYFTWFALQYLQVIPVDSFLVQALGINSHRLVGTPLGSVMLFGPPLLPSMALLCWFILTRGMGRTGEVKRS